MAVAAYASVLSLLRVVDSIQHPSRLRLFQEGTTMHIDALRDQLSFLQNFLELCSSKIMTREEIDALVRNIPRVTCDTEILIDNYVVDKLYRELYPQDDVVGPNIIESSFRDEILRAIREIESVNEALSKLSTIQRDQARPIRVQMDKFTGDEPLKNKVVGFDDQLKRVLEKLTGNQRNLVIVPIVGMGGIGKTTLARSVFDHPYNSHHFHVRVWLTISQDYSLKRVLQGLLADRESSESESELITRLYQKLFGQRYLIVMDDVWSAEAWDDLRRGFPDNENGSRVVVTTRSYDIASSVDSHNNYTYSMEFLDEDQSWDLFVEKAFEKGGRVSLELEEIGRKISKRCKGLPILLASIGGLLASSNMTVEYWQSVARDINSFVNSANDEYCLRVLSLSYHELPIHLKPCFLYTRHFKEDSTIIISELIESWVSHGLVKPMRGKTLEEAARKYAEDLVRRNMLVSRRRPRNGNIKSCSVHDLLRGVSIKESEKERLLELPRIWSSEQCVICNKQKSHMNEVPVSEILGLRSGGEIPVCSSSCARSPFRDFARSRFVAAVKIESQNVPMLTTYRSITLEYNTFDRISVFHTIRLIWNLEILAIYQQTQIVLPKELWEMPQLRHVIASPLCTIPYPASTEHDLKILENLQMLTRVKNFEFTEDVVRRIPNLRHLEVRYDVSEEGVDLSCFYLQNINRLQKLESLDIQCIVVPPMDFNAVSLPCSLKRLTFDGCKISWDEMSIIGSSLPNLEELILWKDAVVGEEWDPTIEGGESLFLRLKYLALSELDLERWRLDGETQFPALETILLFRMEALEEIPREIGELPSLNSIDVCYCSVKVVDSAEAIVEEQQNNGNEMFVITVTESTTGRIYVV